MPELSSFYLKKRLRFANYWHMDLSAWEIGSEETQEAIAVSERIAKYCHDNPDNLKIYSGAIAIDGEHTKDRDDAIKISRSKNQVIVEVFIANPSAFIKKDDRLDATAQNRKTSLYFTTDNLPMLARELSEDALSLNAGKVTPAIRVETRLNAKTGKIESVSYEQCLVIAENLTYEEVSAKIAGGDRKFVGWGQISSWLTSIRAKNSKIPILPDYDPDTGVLTTEEGQLRKISPHTVNAHLLVAEAMILANQSCAILMHNSFEGGLGVYRTQNSIKSPASYTSQPRKHASLGVTDYTHATSPNRRYADILVHRFLAQLGTSYTLELPKNELDLEVFTTAYLPEDLRSILLSINSHMQKEKQFHSDQRREDGEKLLAKIFPDTNPEKLKEFDPISFSIVLKSATEHGMINDIFANEVLNRVNTSGGKDERLSLIFPKDAINLFRFAENCQKENADLWQNIREQILVKLANDPQVLDQVFAEFIGKIGAKDHMQTASFISKPIKKDIAGQTNQARAAAIVMDYAGKKYTTAEFVIGFSPRPTATRAKIEFLRAFGNQTLLEGKQPELPSEEKVYHVHKLYRENATKRRGALLKQGYEIEETTRAFSPSKQTGEPRGYKYDAKILKDGHVVLSVAVRRDNAEDAQRIGMETAIFALREKGHVSANMFAHTGLATFTGKLKNGHGISYDNAMVVSPKRAQISDHEAWEKLIIILSKHCKVELGDKGKSIIISNFIRKTTRADSLNDIVELISDAFPKSELIIHNDRLKFKNPPPALRMMVRESAHR